MRSPSQEPTGATAAAISAPLFLSLLFIGNTFLCSEPGEEGAGGCEEGKRRKEAIRHGQRVADERQGDFGAEKEGGNQDKADPPRIAEHRAPIGGETHGI